MFAEFFTPEQIAIVTQIILIDLVLAGDNAIIIGMVASKFPVEQRKKVIFWGIGGAVILRIIFPLTFLISFSNLLKSEGVLLKAIEFQGKFLQGHFILGKTDPNAKILVGKKEVKVSKDGFFVFGIDRDQKYDLTFTKIINGKKSITTKKVLKRKYNIQRIDGLEESKVTPPESVYKRIKKENNSIGEARAINSDIQFFKDKSSSAIVTTPEPEGLNNILG